jgi:hypothetical protein
MKLRLKSPHFPPFEKGGVRRDLIVQERMPAILDVLPIESASV